MADTSEITFYQLENGKTEIAVTIEKDTVWLNLKQLTELFQRDKSVISRHLNNIFLEKELTKESVVAKNATTASDGKTYRVDYYNLDVIISLGYRIKSQQGIRFRIWAGRVLKDYLIRGFALNEHRLKNQNAQFKELARTIYLLGNVLDQRNLSVTESTGLLKVITDYSFALNILDQYDYQTLKIDDTSGKGVFAFSYEEAILLIGKAREIHGNSSLFGNEKDDSFRSSISAIFQTFDGVDLYPSIEEKAAHLLYFITKNHSFTDGNKRIAAMLFLYFLDMNGILYNFEGNKRIQDNTLVALTLMIAVSNPEDKNTMVNVIVNLINKKN